MTTILYKLGWLVIIILYIITLTIVLLSQSCSHNTISEHRRNCIQMCKSQGYLHAYTERVCQCW